MLCHHFVLENISAFALDNHCTRPKKLSLLMSTCLLCILHGADPPLSAQKSSGIESPGICHLPPGKLFSSTSAGPDLGLSDASAPFSLKVPHEAFERIEDMDLSSTEGTEASIVKCMT